MSSWEPIPVPKVAPLHKSAFGAAVASAVALLLLLTTAFPLLPHKQTAIPLQLLGDHFRGYTVSRGRLYRRPLGGFAGFVGGWFAAFTRNFVAAISLFAIRTHAELAGTRDFLDHG